MYLRLLDGSPFLLLHVERLPVLSGMAFDALRLNLSGSSGQP
jgi:hypothetical protein